MASDTVTQPFDSKADIQDSSEYNKIPGRSSVPKDARAAANYILDRAKQKSVPLTPMQLIKLVYIAHGWNLAINGKPLFHDPVEAWRYGPVVPSVYQAFKAYGRDVIQRPAYGSQYDPLIRLNLVNEDQLQPIQHPFDEKERAVMDGVLEAYGQLDGLKLSSLTHQEETPWSKTAQSSGLDSLIPTEMISEHFKSIAGVSSPKQEDCKGESKIS